MKITAPLLNWIFNKYRLLGFIFNKTRLISIFGFCFNRDFKQDLLFDI